MTHSRGSNVGGGSIFREKLGYTLPLRKQSNEGGRGVHGGIGAGGPGLGSGRVAERVWGLGGFQVGSTVVTRFVEVKHLPSATHEIILLPFPEKHRSQRHV